MLNKLKIAIQSKGKLSDPSINFLKSLGLQFEPSGRQLVSSCTNCDVDILYLRSSDIPEYVSRGIADFGIVGQNVLAEKGSKIRGMKPLAFGECKLIIAVPKKSNITVLNDLNGKQIATSYPETLKEYLDRKSIKVDIINMNGSVEIAPALGLSDAICDLTQTGTTLKDNNLIIIDTILESEAVLIESPFIKPFRGQPSALNKIINLIKTES